MRKIFLTIMVIFILSLGSYSQTGDLSKKSNQGCRAKVIDQIEGEAKKNKMEIDLDTLTSFETKNGSVTVVMEKKSANLSEKELALGVDFMLIYVNSIKPKSLPNGIYKVKIGLDRNSEKSDGGKKYIASFLNSQGRIVRQSPVGTSNNTGSSPAGYIRFGTVFEDGMWKPAIWFSSYREMILWLYFDEP